MTVFPIFPIMVKDWWRKGGGEGPSPGGEVLEGGRGGVASSSCSISSSFFPPFPPSLPPSFKTDLAAGPQPDHGAGWLVGCL